MTSPPRRPSIKRATVTSNSGAVESTADLAAGLSHDFNNILMVMRNCGVFLREGLAEGDSLQRYVTELLKATDRAELLISQLQAFGRAQMLRPEIIRPADIVRAMTQKIRRLVPEDVNLRMSITAEQATVLFDPSQLQVVVENLVSWAARRVGGQRRIWISVAEEEFGANEPAERRGRFVTLTVAKTGSGLDEPSLQRVFHPHVKMGRRSGMTDLRLSSAYGIVTQSGAQIDVQSETGRGTRIKVYMPMVEGDVLVHATRKRALPTALEGDEVILVVEDDPSVRRICRESLERHGYTVLEAENGADALHISGLFETPPNLLLTDLAMPELTGRELIEGLKSKGLLPKTLLMSAYTDDEILKRAGPTERYPFIKKPFSHQELAERVREVLDS
ncbi:MAG: response regulator [Gemmatimonadaceae bacterium]